MSQINRVKELLFGIFLMVLALWAFFMAVEGGIVFLFYLSLLSPIAGIIFAIIGLLKKDK